MDNRFEPASAPVSSGTDVADEAPRHPPAGRHRYPVEGSGWIAGIATFVLVFLPSAAMLLSPILSDPPRMYTVVFGNWMSPFILWCASATALYIHTKRRRLRREAAAARRLADELSSTLGNTHDGGSSESSRRERELGHLLNEAVVWAGKHNVLHARCRALLDANYRAPAPHETLETVSARLCEIDRSASNNSFTFPRVLVWATPILGFIGTVWGISSAVAEFSDAAGSYGSAAAASVALSESLPGVTRGLALAFDSTFLALICALLLSLFLSGTEKRERAYLDGLDRLWTHSIAPSLVGLLRSHSSAAAPQDLANEVAQAAAKVRALDAAIRDLGESAYMAGIGEVANETAIGPSRR